MSRGRNPDLDPMPEKRWGIGWSRIPLESFSTYAIDLLFVALLLWAFFLIVDPGPVFRETHVAGGDMVSHPWISKSLKEAWFKGNVWSWNPGWFAGFPFLYFYFYPTYILALALEVLGFSEAVSFKLAVLVTVLAVPLIYYLTGRRWLSQPLAFLFATLGMALFFNEFDSRWGGNFKSVLAGQISHNLGLVSLVGFCSYLVKGETNKKSAILFYALTVLAHVYSALFGTLLLCSYLLVRAVETRSPRRVLVNHAIGPLVAVLGTAFWWIPFISYRRFTVAPINQTIVDWQEISRILQLDNSLYVLIYSGAFVFLLANLVWGKRRDYFNLSLFLLVIVTTFSLLFLAGTPFLHIRFPSAIYLLSLLVFTVGLRNLSIQRSLQWILVGSLGLVTLQSILPSRTLDRYLPDLVRHGVVDAPHWWRWNMSGIESKPYSQQVLGVWRFLEAIEDPEGRVAVEYGNYNSFGSPRIFELTPFFTGKSVMEGLLMESSTVYPAYFYISLHINPTTWWPGFPVTVPQYDVAKGIDLFSRYNVKYFVAARRETQQALAELGAELLFKNRRFEIYKVNETSRIASRLVGTVPVIYSRNPLMETVLNFPESLTSFVEIRAAGPRKPGPTLKQLQTENLQRLFPADGHWSTDGQSYAVADTGATPANPQNILFKIPYFPNWQTDTGDPVRLVTPNLMMVRTSSPSVSISYRAAWPEKIGATLALCGLFLLLALQIRRLKGRATH